MGGIVEDQEVGKGVRVEEKWTVGRVWKGMGGVLFSNLASCLLNSNNLLTQTSLGPCLSSFSDNSSIKYVVDLSNQSLH